MTRNLFSRGTYAFWSLAALVPLGTYVVYYEQFVIPAPLYQIYLWPKLILILISLFLLVALYGNEQKKGPLYVLGLCMTAEVCWSAYFRHEYHVAYFQTMMAFAFAAGKIPRFFYTNLMAGALILILIYIQAVNAGFTIAPPLFLDIVVEIAIYSLVSLAVFFVFVRVQANKANQSRLLQLIGSQSVRHLHDLKGLLMSPMLTLERVVSKTKNLPGEVHHQANNLTVTFSEIQNHLRRFSSLIQKQTHLYLPQKETSPRSQRKFHISYPVLVQIVGGMAFFAAGNYEAYLVPPAYADSYWYFKMAGALTAWSFAFLFHFGKRTHLFSSLAYLNFLLIGSFSGIFRPGYQHCFFQSAIAMAFCMEEQMTTYLILTIAGAGLHIAGLFWGERFGVLNHSIQLSDRIIEVLLFFTICTLVYRFFSQEKNQSVAVQTGLENIGESALSLSKQIETSISNSLRIAQQVQASPSDTSVDVAWKQLKSDMTQSLEFVSALELLAPHLPSESPCERTPLCPATVKQILHQSARLFARKGRQPDLDICDLDIVPDPVQPGFNSIFYNLILNSIEAAQQNAVQDLKIQAWREGRYFVYRDNAGGMTQEALAKILNKEIYTSKKTGSGLGLQIIRYEVGRWCGELAIRPISSTLGTGMEFRFRLPSFRIIDETYQSVTGSDLRSARE